MKIAHLINPVKVTEASDLYKAQPVTFETMLAARKYLQDPHRVTLFGMGFPEDLEILPCDFHQLPPLQRSVMEVGPFRKVRKLPLISDLLQPLSTLDEVDYIIYTNVDIAVMPFFYDYIRKKIEAGSDSLIINRRVIDENLSGLEEMYAQVGDSHPGYDCFVFRKELLSRFDLGTACIGANYIGRVIIANLIVFSRRLEIIKDAHLTFHLGNDGAWLTNNYSEFDLHNKKQAYQIINRLIDRCKGEEKRIQLREIIEFLDSREHMDLQKSLPSATQVTDVKDEKWSLKRKIKFKLRKLLT